MLQLYHVVDIRSCSNGLRNVLATGPLGAVLATSILPLLRPKVVAGCADDQDAYRQCDQAERCRRLQSFANWGEIGFRLHEIFAGSQSENRSPILENTSDSAFQWLRRTPLQAARGKASLSLLEAGRTVSRPG